LPTIARCAGRVERRQSRRVLADELADGTIYFACENTALFYDMKLIGAAASICRAAHRRPFTMGPTTPLKPSSCSPPRKVVPSHFNTWPPIAQDTAPWVARIKAETKAEPIVVVPVARITL